MGQHDLDDGAQRKGTPGRKVITIAGDTPDDLTAVGCDPSWRDPSRKAYGSNRAPSPSAPMSVPLSRTPRSSAWSRSRDGP
ncbi:hypothetical protein [Streptomyces hawaiiensis]|uniref:hypothetical protein n=1 Tax=Streptomyces hawaiiensis TaxID=67305 RepID=UPI00364D859C